MDRNRMDALNGLGAAGVGIGTLVFALFPLAIPFLLLTAVFLAPLALIGLVVGVAVGIVAVVALAARGLSRRIGGRAYRLRRSRYGT